MNVNVASPSTMMLTGAFGSYRSSSAVDPIGRGTAGTPAPGLSSVRIVCGCLFSVT